MEKNQNQLVLDEGNTLIDDFSSEESEILLSILDNTFEVNLFLANCMFPQMFEDEEEIEPY